MSSIKEKIKEKQMVDTEPCRLREAETRTKTQEEDQIQVNTKLHCWLSYRHFDLISYLFI